MKANWQEMIIRAQKTSDLSIEEITAILGAEDAQGMLIQAADEVRRKCVGEEIHLRGLIEFSNRCRRNCFYCGLRCDNRSLERYYLAEDAVVDLAKEAIRCGYRTIVLQSGEDLYFDADRMASIIRRIKEHEVAVTLSIGEKTREEYEAYRKAGADRYLLRIETTDEKLYTKLHPGQSLSERKRCLRDLKELGYEVGTGSIIGLPDQTDEMIARDIRFFREIGADMIGLGPFIPHGDTPLRDEAGGDFDKSLRVLALVRLLLPYANIPATTAMETLRPQEGRRLALSAGANVVMLNVTSRDRRGLYQLYPGKAKAKDDPMTDRIQIETALRAMGRTVGMTCGNSKAWQENQK